MNQHPKPGQHGPMDGPPNNPDGGSGEPQNKAARPDQQGFGAAQPEVQRASRGQGQQENQGLSNHQTAISKDINPILDDWEFEPGTINVRKVSGADGKPKLQMRLDLGLLQMEMSGRPDGQQPYGCESLLEYYEKRLADHRKRNGTDDGFEISGAACRNLREEAAMYYQRYLSLFVLEEFSGVVRDTARNLRLLDLCSRFAAEEEDRIVMEQFRPYITMMNARARASISLRHKRYREALREIENGIGDIREFFDRFGQPEAFGRANEVKVLKRFAREVRRKLPVDPLKRLQKKLDRAVKDERYEEAARLRDKIAVMKGHPGGPQGARRDARE